MLLHFGEERLYFIFDVNVNNFERYIFIEQTIFFPFSFLFGNCKLVYIGAINCISNRLKIYFSLCSFLFSGSLLTGNKN